MDSIGLSLFIRSAVILIAANLLSRIPRRASSSYRHRILLLGFWLLLLWPVFSAALPQVQFPLWPYGRTRDSVTVQQTSVILQRRAPESNRIHWPVAIWLTGVLFSLTPLLLGHLKVRRMKRRAAPLQDELFQELCSETGMGKEPELRLAPGPVMPLTFGFLRPVILVPAGYATWPALRRRSVLLHELAHIQRRDVASHLFIYIITALWWFQPLGWIHYWMLRRESERSCDALVLAWGVRPSDYAAQLLQIARDFQATRHWSAAAIAMARPSELETRLHTILDPCLNPRGRTRSLAAAAALILWSITASAITFTPQQNHSSRGISMKRTLLASLLSSVGLSAATIGGSLFDPSGVAIPEAKASLYNPETAVKTEITTTTEGKFAFDNLPAGQYILRVDAPGFAPLYRAFNVGAESKLERGLMLNAKEHPEAGSDQSIVYQPADSQPLNPGQLRVKGSVEQENLIQKVQPMYPYAAKKAGVQGTVMLEVAISKDGVPQEIKVVSSPSDDLTQSALEAVRQWRYRPLLLNGQPVDIVTEVIVNYTLRR